MSTITSGRQYLAELWLKQTPIAELRHQLSVCRNSPSNWGEGGAALIKQELARRGELKYDD